MNTLKIKELENRKDVLAAAKNNIKSTLAIKTYKGIYEVKSQLVLTVIENEIDAEIEDINTQLEQLTGLNEERLIYLNEVGR